ncbi:PAS domain S-box protein [Candidatus Poribacteria bacterium]|nr:PAS domain S-box protein [Candidatus Poribacteria bacterium]
MCRDSVGTDGGKTPRVFFRHIRTRLITHFILVFVAVLAFVEATHIAGMPFPEYPGQWKHRKLEAFRTLSLVADLKKQQLLSWIGERRGDARAYATNPLVRENADRLQTLFHKLENRGAREADLWSAVRNEESFKALEECLQEIKVAYGVYSRIRIADAKSGRILVSTDIEDVGGVFYHPERLQVILASDTEHLTNVELPQTKGGSLSGNSSMETAARPVLHVARAIKDREGSACAVLLMEVNIDTIIKPMLASGKELGLTGEVVLVDMDARILHSLKYPLADGSRARPLDYHISARPVLFAISGREGVIEAKDYRGVMVLAACRNLVVTREMRWGMVVKRDRAELFKPLWDDIAWSLSVGVVGLLAAVGLTVFVARNITRPLLSLKYAAIRAAEGDLDVRAPTTSSDEVGDLAGAFNEMIAHVQRRNSLLAESEERFRLAFQDAPIGMAIVGLDNRFVKVNRSLCEMLCYTEPELTALAFVDVTHPEDIDKDLELSRKLIAGEISSYDLEKRYFSKHKDIIWINLRATIIRDENGAPLYYLAMIENITERKRAEFELRETMTELKRSNAELDSFAYTVAHDLRTPLRGMDGFSQALLEDYAEKLDAEGKHCLSRIRGASQRMARIIDDLLSLSRVSRVEMRQESVDLSRLAETIASGLRQIEPDRRAEVLIQEGLIARGDANLLGLALENLLGNAWKFTRKRSEARIEFGRIESNGDSAYFVRDNGAGFDMKYVNKLFGTFQRLHAAAEFEGSGIGLATVQRVIHRHGGKVWANGAVEEGATFYFTL